MISNAPWRGRRLRPVIANLYSTLGHKDRSLRGCIMLLRRSRIVPYHIQPRGIHKIDIIFIKRAVAFPVQNSTISSKAPLITVKQLRIGPVSDDIEKPKVVLYL